MRTVIIEVGCDFCQNPVGPDESLSWDGMPVTVGDGRSSTYLVDVCEPCMHDTKDKSVWEVFATISTVSRKAESDTRPRRKSAKRLRKPYTEEEGPFYCHAVDDDGVCGRKFDRYQGLGTHLTRTHKINGEEKIPLLTASRKTPGTVESA